MITDFNASYVKYCVNIQYILYRVYVSPAFRRHLISWELMWRCITRQYHNMWGLSSLH